MSTNFYTVHIPTELEYAKMQEALTNKQLDRLQELIDQAQHRYHLGKRSGGWQFMFVPHTNKRTGEIISPWEDNLASIKEYLSREDVKIIDEYGEEYTCESFFEEIKDILYHGEHAINGYDQVDDVNSRVWYNVSDVEYTTEEGLRFATNDDWS